MCSGGQWEVQWGPTAKRSVADPLLVQRRTTSVDSFSSRLGYGPFCMAFHRASSSASALINVNSSISASVSGRVPIVEFKVAAKSTSGEVSLSMHWEPLHCDLKCSSQVGCGAMKMAVSPCESPCSNGGRGVAVTSHVLNPISIMVSIVEYTCSILGAVCALLLRDSDPQFPESSKHFMLRLILGCDAILKKVWHTIGQKVH